MAAANSGSVGRGKPFDFGNRRGHVVSTRQTTASVSHDNRRSARDTGRVSRG